MPEILDIDSFLNRAQQALVVDVRSPGEFAQGHIPGAVNAPLFLDAERAEVGTLYKKKGREAAMLLGLRHAGARLDELGAHLAALPGREVLLHCWRGGMRSASMAWLAEMMGRRVATLGGGYKTFRRWAIESTGHGEALIHVVAGLTGSGKTQVLHALEALGECVIDLEKLAHHKGSAFGDLGEPKQPTQEQFENELAMAWRARRPDAPLWVEDESRTVGRCVLPEAFWQAKQAGLFHVLDLPEEARLDHLGEIYLQHDAEKLIARIRIIHKRLGGDRTAAAIHAVENGDLRTAAKLVLAYYDRTYSHAVDSVPPDRVRRFAFARLDAGEIAQTLRAARHPVSA